MAESRNGSVYEHFRRAWPWLAAVGCSLVWIGRNVQTPEQIDSRVREIVRPLQDRSKWIEKELLRHEQQKFHPALADEIRKLEERMYRLEPK